MKRPSAALLFALVAAATCVPALAAEARVSLTVVDAQGKPLRGGLFVFSRADDPTAQFSIGEADDGTYRASVDPGEPGDWQLTQVLVDGFLPIEVTATATDGAGAELQRVETMALNPGIAVPPLKIVAGGSLQLVLVLDRRDEVMKLFMEARKAARRKAEEEAAAGAIGGTGLGEAYDTALRLYNGGDVEGALPHFEQAAAEHPDHLDVRRTHANVLYKLKRFEAFESAAAEVLRLDPGNRELLMMLYSSQRTRGDLNAALATLLEVRKAGGGSELAEHFNFIARKLAPAAAAIPAYEALLEFDPNNIGLCETLAWLHAEAGHADESSAYLERAVAAEPSRAGDVYFEFGGRLLQLADRRPAVLDRALSLLRKTVELEPGFAEAHKRLGLALWKKQDLAGAKKAFQRYLELNPDAVDRGTINDYLVQLSRR